MVARSRDDVLAQIQAVEAEISRRTAPGRILSTCFGPQQQFVTDTSRLRAAVCGRRAGKTYGVASWLVQGALMAPETLSLYIHLSRAEAKRTIWLTIKRLDHELGLGGTFKEADLEYHLPNGSVVWITGCPDSTHIENFRGKAYKRIAIDEAASYPSYLTRLIEDVLLPALVDHRGDLALIGTPAVTPTGYLYDVAHGNVQGWSQSHHWTMLDNPHLPHAAQEMEEMRVRRGWSEDHPTYRREWLGLWVADHGMLVYHGFNSQRCIVEALPDDLEPWHYVLGVDLGASADHETTAYSLVAYSDKSPTAFVMETRGEAGATPSSIAERIARYDATYHFDGIVMDAGALGAGYVRELRERHRLPVEPAEKQNKRGYVELLNGDLLGTGLRLVRANTGALQSEMAVLPWGDDTKTKEKSGVPNHHCDATLYAWRRCRQYGYVAPPPPKPKLGSDDYWKAEQERVEQGLVKRAQNRSQRPWWQQRPGR